MTPDEKIAQILAFFQGQIDGLNNAISNNQGQINSYQAEIDKLKAQNDQYAAQLSPVVQFYDAVKAIIQG